MNNDVRAVNDPSAIIVDKIELERFDGTRKIDIKPLIVSMTLADDITSPSVYGYLVIADSNDILGKNANALIGEEFVHVYLTQPAQSTQLPEKKLEYKFIVNTVDTEALTEQSSGSVFRIELRSVDNLINAGAMRSKSYANTSTNIVKTILEKELQTERPIVNFEDTTGETSYAFTETKPFEKIAIVAAQAYNNREFVTSTFTFYENFEGYNFESIENIIQRNIETTPVKYEYKSDVSSDRDGKTSIISYIKPHRFNAALKLSYGYANTCVVSYNLVEKKPEIRNITLAKELANSTAPRLNSIDLRGSNTFIDKVRALGNLTYLIPYAPPNAYIPERVDNTNVSLLYSSPFTVILEESTILVRVYGTLHHDIGKLVELAFPDNMPITESQAKRIDEDLSGKYIISAVSHEIQNTGGKFEFFTNMTCVKESSLRRADYYDRLYTNSNQISIPVLQSFEATTAQE